MRAKFVQLWRNGDQALVAPRPRARPRAAGADSSAEDSSGPKSKPLQYSHMLSLAVVPGGGGLLAAWQAASVVEGASDQAIYYSLSTDGGGESFEPPRRAFKAEGLWAPVLAEVEGTVVLFFAQTPTKCLQHNADKVWGVRRWIVGGNLHASRWDPRRMEWLGPSSVRQMRDEGDVPLVIANAPVAVEGAAAGGSGGRVWLLPFFRQAARDGACHREDGVTSAGVLRSVDGGAHWSSHGHIRLAASEGAPGSNGGELYAIEPTLLPMGNGTLMMLLRTQRDGLAYSSSEDGGVRWSEPARLWRGVPNADAKPTALSIASASRGEFARTLLLINNDHPRLRLPNATLSGQRERLTLHAARDGDPDRWATVAVVDRELAEWTADGGGFDGLPDHGGRSSGAVAGVPVRTHYACAVELPGREALLVGFSRTYASWTAAADAAPFQARHDGLWIMTLSTKRIERALAEQERPSAPASIFESHV